VTTRRLGRPLARVTSHSIALLRQATGRADLAVIEAVRCPSCELWVSPRRFDLRHLACRVCVRTLGRPTRLGRGWW
jgi:hypothetical protein